MCVVSMGSVVRGVFSVIQSQEVAKQKAKKKKVKKVTVSGVGVTGVGGEKHWSDLFTLPEREGMLGEEAATDER